MMVDDLASLGLLRRDALRSMETMQAYQFVQGGPPRLRKVQQGRLVHLHALTDLHDLDLGRTKVTDAGMEHLKGLTRPSSPHIPTATLESTLVAIPRQSFPAPRPAITISGMGPHYWHTIGESNFPWERDALPPAGVISLARGSFRLLPRAGRLVVARAQNRIAKEPATASRRYSS